MDDRRVLTAAKAAGFIGICCGFFVAILVKEVLRVKGILLGALPALILFAGCAFLGKHIDLCWRGIRSWPNKKILVKVSGVVGVVVLLSFAVNFGSPEHNGAWIGRAGSTEIEFVLLTKTSENNCPDTSGASYYKGYQKVTLPDGNVLVFDGWWRGAGDDVFFVMYSDNGGSAADGNWGQYKLIYDSGFLVGTSNDKLKGVRFIKVE